MSRATQARDPDLDSDLRALISEVVDKPDKWLDTPNDQLGGKKPSELIGTNREGAIRDLARAIKIGMPT
jgi:Protein of unknown function (DUF2384)